MTDNPKTMRAEDKIADLFDKYEVFLSADMFDEIHKVVQQAVDQARKEGFESGYKKGVEEQFDESEAVTVKARGKKRS